MTGNVVPRSENKGSGRIVGKPEVNRRALAFRGDLRLLRGFVTRCWLVLRVGQRFDYVGELEDLKLLRALVPIVAPTNNYVATV